MQNVPDDRATPARIGSSLHAGYGFRSTFDGSRVLVLGPDSVCIAIRRFDHMTDTQLADI